MLELLGVLGILPVHPQTNLRLKKFHETRKNTPLRNARLLQGEKNFTDAAEKWLAQEDLQLRIDQDGIETLYYKDGNNESCNVNKDKIIILNLADWAHYPEKLAKIREQRAIKQTRFDEMTANEINAAEKKRRDIEKRHSLQRNIHK